MRILGIDPGSTATGYGVVECRASRLVHVAHGTLRPSARDSLPLRLASLQGSLQEVIELHEPEVVSVERVFVAASARSALVLGHARGVILAASARAGLPVAEYAARPPSDSFLVVRAPVLDRRRKLHKLLAGAGRLLSFEAAASNPLSSRVLPTSTSPSRRGMQ